MKMGQLMLSLLHARLEGGPGKVVVMLVFVRNYYEPHENFVGIYFYNGTVEGILLRMAICTVIAIR